MLTLREAQVRVLGAFTPSEAVRIPVTQAFGLTSAEEVTALEPLPRFDNSAMDGFAVRSQDVIGASSSRPTPLRVVGEARAGAATAAQVAAGTAVQIMTGGVMPVGADAIVPVEDILEGDDGDVMVTREVQPGAYLRKAGVDVSLGEVAVPAGVDLGPGELAIVTALGYREVAVRLPPRVALLVTGDELVGVGGAVGQGQIRDSNSIALSALVQEAGGRVVSLQRVSDEMEATVDAFALAARSADLVVSSGGVAVGRYDLVKRAVEELGRIDFWKVAVQPGKPVVLGSIEGTPFLGLPGNPVSVHISFEQFVRPALRRLRGCATLWRPRVTAHLATPLEKPGGRLHLVRVRLQRDQDGFLALPTGPQGSHVMSSLVDCHGLAFFDADLERLEQGDPVTVEVWRLPGEAE